MTISSSSTTPILVCDYDELVRGTGKGRHLLRVSESWHHGPGHKPEYRLSKFAGHRDPAMQSVACLWTVRGTVQMRQ